MTELIAKIHPPELLKRSFEEILNSLTHGLGLVLSIVGLVALETYAVMRGNGWHIAGVSVFGVALVLLYGASTLYHSARHPDWKRVLRMADHSCIYLLIAGTYTPFTLTILRGSLGWTMFALVWAMAILGIAFKLRFRHRFEILSTVLYLAMGWVAVIGGRSAYDMIPAGCFGLLLGGGLAYTGGVIFYALDKVPYFHPVWHLFVMAGSACHYVAVLFYVLP